MKKIFALVIVFFIAITAFSQQTTLDKFNIERQKISKNGLKVLTSYTIANIVYGTIASSQARDNNSNKYFHEMNAVWNGITLGIVGIGFLTAKKEGTLDYATSLKKQGDIEKLFLFNAGLDLAYIAGGAYIKERSKTSLKNPPRLRGYGESLMLQGGVLLLFDGIMYSIHNKHGKGLNKMAEKINLSSTTNGIGIIVKL